MKHDHRIFDRLPQPAAVCDGGGRLAMVNALFAGTFGEDGVFENLEELVSDADRPSLNQAIVKALDQGSAEVHVVLPEMSDLRTCLRLATLDSSGDEELVVLFELEHRRTAQEWERLNQLATGVAHELKNPLTSILNYADYLLTKYRGQFFEKRDGERLERIVEGVERIDSFIRELLNTAGPDELTMEEVCLHRTIEEAIGLCDGVLAEHGVQVECRFEAGRTLIFGSSNGLLQLYANLLTNAALAMPEEGGKITVVTGNDGDDFVSSVKDDACGMSEETVERIFEPFFTTRRDREGSGLGLALVQRLVDRHRGRISVESELGQGTTFTLRFPALPTT
ncbi:MAG: ATP-binding protein [Bradymonadaceae bacterium]